MNTKTIIAFDPGVEGAIVILSSDGKIKAVFNMPVIETEKPKAKKKPKKDAPAKKPKKESLFTVSRTVDFNGVRYLLEPFFLSLRKDECEIYVEEITHLFALPSSTNFKLGHAVGVIHSAIQSFTDEFYLVPVKKWQAGVWIEDDHVLKPNKRIDTKKTTEKAFNRIFPDYDGINSDGVRDAALIAYFALTGGL